METETILATHDSATEVEEHPLSGILQEEEHSQLKPGEIVEGPLVSRGTASIFVNLGIKGTGIIYGREFFLAQELLKQKDIGEIVSAKVVDPENDDGYVELSVSAAYQEIAWEQINRILKDKETISVTIDSANRGGLLASVHSVSAFLPVSQLSQEHYPRVEGGDKEKILEALRAFSGQSFMVKIINAEQRSEKLIISEKAVEEEALRKELQGFNIGDTVDGLISGIVDFGLFLKFGPSDKLEGLAHISELSWETIADIHAKFKLGDRITVKIVDLQGDKVSFSLKALEPDPWQELKDDDFAESKEVTGKPVRFTSFGTFIEVTPGVQGIIRVSGFANEKAMKDAFEIGKAQTFLVVSLDKTEHRMELRLPGSEAPKPKETKDSTEAENVSKEKSEGADEATEESEEPRDATEEDKEEGAKPSVTTSSASDESDAGTEDEVVPELVPSEAEGGEAADAETVKNGEGSKEEERTKDGEGSKEEGKIEDSASGESDTNEGKL